jgi:hypothetical protein
MPSTAWSTTGAANETAESNIARSVTMLINFFMLVFSLIIVIFCNVFSPSLVEQARAVHFYTMGKADNIREIIRRAF